jgi:hypothetical protein
MELFQVKDSVTCVNLCRDIDSISPRSRIEGMYELYLVELYELLLPFYVKLVSLKFWEGLFAHRVAYVQLSTVHVLSMHSVHDTGTVYSHVNLKRGP